MMCENYIALAYSICKNSFQLLIGLSISSNANEQTFGRCAKHLKISWRTKILTIIFTKLSTDRLFNSRQLHDKRASFAFAFAFRPDFSVVFFDHGANDIKS